MARYDYTAMGLRITSDFEVPELASRDGGDADVFICACALPRELEDARRGGLVVRAAVGRILLRIASVGRYLVSDGREIQVDARPGVEDARVRLYLLGVALGALLHQRGLLPLHGSAIETSRGAAIFVGPSGHGKSTLAGLMCRRGYRVLADDIAAVSTESDSPLLYPGLPHLRLSKDAASRLELEAQDLVPSQDGEEKLRVALGAKFRQTPILVHSIYVLSDDRGAGPELTPLTGLDAVHGITENTYRLRLLRLMEGDLARHFRQVCSLARKVRITRLSRGREHWEPDALTELLERDFAT